MSTWLEVLLSGGAGLRAREVNVTIYMAGRDAHPTEKFVHSQIRFREGGLRFTDTGFNP